MYFSLQRIEQTTENQMPYRQPALALSISTARSTTGSNDSQTGTTMCMNVPVFVQGQKEALLAY